MTTEDTRGLPTEAITLPKLRLIAATASGWTQTEDNGWLYIYPNHPHYKCETWSLPRPDENWVFAIILRDDLAVSEQKDFAAHIEFYVLRRLRRTQAQLTPSERAALVLRHLTPRDITLAFASIRAGVRYILKH